MPATEIRRTLLLLAAGGFVSGLSIRLAEPLLPKVAHDFGVSVAAASVLITGFTLAYGLFQLVHGPLGDRIGKLRAVVGCAGARRDDVGRVRVRAVSGVAGGLALPDRNDRRRGDSAVVRIHRRQRALRAQADGAGAVHLRHPARPDASDRCWAGSSAIRSAGARPSSCRRARSSSSVRCSAASRATVVQTSCTPTCPSTRSRAWSPAAACGVRASSWRPWRSRASCSSERSPIWAPTCATISI